MKSTTTCFLLVFALLSGCNKATDPNPATKLLYPKEIKANIGGYLQRFTYDAEKRIVEEYTWESGYAEYFYYKYDDFDRIIQKTTLNSKKDSMWYALYTYNANDQLLEEKAFSMTEGHEHVQNGYVLHEYNSQKQKIKTSRYSISETGVQLDGYYTFEYGPGTSITTNAYAPDEKLEVSIREEYDTQNNPFSAFKSIQVLDRMYFSSAYPKKHNIIKYTIIQPDGTTSIAYENLYEYNKEGYPIKRKEIACCNQSLRNETITYLK